MFIVEKPHRFYWEKICSIHYLHFSFEKHVPSQVLKDFSVENLETTPSTFLSKFSSEIYLSRIINYWGSIFTLYLTRGTFSLVCVLSSFFSFFLLFFFFYRYFPWQTLTIDRIAGKGEGIIIFLVFNLHPLTNIHLVQLRFLEPFFLLKLILLARLRLSFYLHFYWCN